MGSFNQSTETQYLFQCATSLSKAVLVFPKKWINMGLDAIDKNAVVCLCRLMPLKLAGSVRSPSFGMGMMTLLVHSRGAVLVSNTRFMMLSS